MGTALRLSDFLDTGLVAHEVANGYISCSEHPKDHDLKILCYGKMAQLQGRWNEATKQCRGLIIRSSSSDFSDAEVVARPWRKFFTLQQLQGVDGKRAWALGDEEEGSPSIEADIAQLDFDAPAEVTDKVDGSMIVLYRDPRDPAGAPACATKGSFTSDQAIASTKLLRNDPAYREAATRLLAQHPETTFIFEYVSPENHIVLYYPKPKLIFLGAVATKTGEYLSTKAFKQIWGAELGLSCAEKQPARNLGEAIHLAARDGKEGVVVRILGNDPNKQMMVKVKEESYLALHHLLAGFGESAVRQAILGSAATYGDMCRLSKTENVEMFPEIAKVINFSDDPTFSDERHKRRQQFIDALVPQARKAAGALSFMENLPDADFAGDPREVKRKFALMIDQYVQASGADKATLFAMADMRIRGIDISAEQAAPSLSAAAKSVSHIIPIEG